MLETTFWKNAANSLPAEVRDHYRLDIEQAERWELGVARMIEAWGHLKAVFVRMFQTPHEAH